MRPVFLGRTEPAGLHEKEERTIERRGLAIDDACYGRAAWPSNRQRRGPARVVG